MPAGTSEADLARQGLLAHLIPTLVEPPLELGDIVLGRLMRSVTIPRREIQEEGLVWSSRVLRAHPVDGPIGQITNQDVVWVAKWWQHWCRVLKQRGMKLVCITAQKAIEILKAQATGPLIKRPSRTLHPLWNEVVFAEPRCVVAVVYENVADRARALGYDRRIPWISRGELRDVTHADALVVASGE